MIPTLLIGFTLAAVLSIVVVPLLGLVDQLLGHRRFRLARAWLLGVGAAYAETGGTLWCGVLWLRYGLTRRLHDEPSMRAHERVQDWWVRAHLRNFRRTANLHIAIDRPEMAGEGNAVAIVRHSSHADAVLPAYVFLGVGGLALRYTLKETLQLAPGLDLAANRLPNVFIDRTPGPDSPLLTRLEELAAGTDDHCVTVIFPEGTFHTPERLDRAATRLGATRPDLEPLARTLRYMLPPRPAGTIALLRGAPDADIVLMGHVGLEGFGSMKEMLRRIPLDAPLRVRMWRYDRATVPTDEKDLVTWLLERWVEIDEWTGEQLALRAAGDYLAPDEHGNVPIETIA